jgi:DNA polymerase
LTGTGKSILKRRGGVEMAGDGTPVFLTIHPSYILRLPEESLRVDARKTFRADLELASRYLEKTLRTRSDPMRDAAR